MITYDNRAYLRIICRWSGSAIWSRLVVLPTLVSCAISVFLFQYPELLSLVDHADWPAWVFSTVLAFAVVFRGALAYSRYWQGVESSFQMMSKWQGAYVNLLGFLDASIEEHEARGNAEIVAKLQSSRSLIFHWFSLLFAFAVQSLQWREDPEPVLRSMVEPDLDMLSRHFWSPIDGSESSRICVHNVPTRVERDSLSTSFDKLSSLIHWIWLEVSKLHLHGQLLVHSSILTRIYEDLSSGAKEYCEVHTIAFIPFPFSFAQVLWYALYAFSILCPFIVQASVGFVEGSMERSLISIPAVIVMNVILVAAFTALNEIATDLEDPFAESDNSFPIRVLQRRLIMSLKASNNIVHPRDFSLDRFGGDTRSMASRHERVAMANALRRRQPPAPQPPQPPGAAPAAAGGSATEAAVSPMVAVMGACEDLKDSVVKCVQDAEHEEARLKADTCKLELQVCDLAYRLLLQRGTPCPPWTAACAHAAVPELVIRRPLFMRTLTRNTEERPVEEVDIEVPTEKHARVISRTSDSEEVSALWKIGDVLNDAHQVDALVPPLLIHHLRLGELPTRSPNDF